MHPRIAIGAMLALGACSTVSEKSFSLPAETIAHEIGPSPATGTDPRIFLAGSVDEGSLRELAPYCGKQISVADVADETRCARVAMLRLVESRPDAILVVSGRPEVTAVTTTFYANPFVPGLLVPTSTTSYRTTCVAYAMRAMRVTLPFRYNTASGTVTDITDRSATPGLLEGDVLTGIAGADALPPKSWPEWPLYARLLQHSPGDVVELAWVRAGTGKMTGTVRLAPATAPHRQARSSIDTTRMSPVEEIEKDGRRMWRLRPDNPGFDG